MAFCVLAKLLPLYPNGRGIRLKSENVSVRIRGGVLALLEFVAYNIFVVNSALVAQTEEAHD